VTMNGIDQGVVASGTVLSMLIYDCILRGNNPWDAAFIESNLTWNDDGLRIPGEGNCAFDNTISGFGDTCAVQDGVFSAAVFFYRNRIEMTGDDACEGDYSTRNFAFYDNHVSNCATALSLDPVWGGPLYFFRNIVVNTTRGPFKLNNTNSGFMIYNNTIVRTDGLSGWAWAQPNNGALVGWSYRNNLLLFAADGNLLALESSGNDPVDFTNNAWFPDGSVWWTNSGGSYGSLQEARDGLEPTVPLFGESTERHAADVLLEAEPFVDPVPLGADHLTEVTSLFVPTLADGSVAQGGGVAIDNVTDGFSGAAPDIGAVIAGRPLPEWGAG
ncbi:MAG: right-handed parallel beta-helix repeat-containing protein, partial [Myxococcota bacterium]